MCINIYKRDENQTHYYQPQMVIDNPDVEAETWELSEINKLINKLLSKVIQSVFL